MRSETGHIGINLAVWAGVTAPGAGVLAVVPVPWWGWTAFVLWALAWLSGVLGLGDGPSRAFLAGSLRKFDFTQVYQTLTRRNVTWLWARLGRPVADGASVPRLLRAGLTLRLAVATVLLALVYPVALISAQWILSGTAAGTQAAFWPSRGLALGVLIVALPVALPLAFDDRRGLPLRLGAVIGAAAAIAATLPSDVLPGGVAAVALVLALLAALNGLFDMLACAVTLTFLRRGLRSAPFLWALGGLAVACGLFLALGATLVAVVHGLNTLAGVPLVDPGALFAGIRETPADYWWLYLMLFSTILPTAVHATVSLLGVQGIWPKAWRRPVASWVDAAPDSPAKAVRAGLGLSVIWTAPMLLMGAILWALWAGLGGLLTAGLEAYFRLLLWIAHVPVGAL